MAFVVGEADGSGAASLPAAAILGRAVRRGTSEVMARARVTFVTGASSGLDVSALGASVSWVPAG
jgi:hypothetical protein